MFILYIIINPGKAFSLKCIHMYCLFLSIFTQSPTMEVMQIYFCMQIWDPNKSECKLGPNSFVYPAVISYFALY